MPFTAPNVDNATNTEMKIPWKLKWNDLNLMSNGWWNWWHITHLVLSMQTSRMPVLQMWRPQLTSPALHPATKWYKTKHWPIHRQSWPTRTRFRWHEANFSPDQSILQWWNSNNSLKEMRRINGIFQLVARCIIETALTIHCRQTNRNRMRALLFARPNSYYRK